MSTAIALLTGPFNPSLSDLNTLIRAINAAINAASIDSLAVSGNVTVSGYTLRSVGAALTAAGTTRADALQLAKETNNLTTVASGTGAVLPVGVIGMRIRVYNNGAQTLALYATASETINGTAGATGVTLAATKVADLEFTAANTWISVALN